MVVMSSTTGAYPTTTTLRMQPPWLLTRCRCLRSAYLATRSNKVTHGSAMTTYPLARSALVAYDRIATVAVRNAPALSTLRNSSGPTPMNLESYPPASATVASQANGSARLATQVGDRMIGHSVEPHPVGEQPGSEPAEPVDGARLAQIAGGP